MKSIPQKSLGNSGYCNTLGVPLAGFLYGHYRDFEVLGERVQGLGFSPWVHNFISLIITAPVLVDHHGPIMSRIGPLWCIHTASMGFLYRVST